ncbi:hypothetical protein [Xanthomonas dyei]|nr:hypothetical protein [Xanthomonas dyei]MCC4634095.1 hypothetical protein [Xanthomonas dyei pv. eucalypti]
MLLAIALVGQLAALKPDHRLVYLPPMVPAGRVDEIEVRLQGIADW